MINCWRHGREIVPTACHVKSRCMSPSAISEAPATQNDLACNQGGRHQVPRLPRKVPRRHRRQIRTKRATQYHECHACHAKRRWMRVLCHACHVKRGWMSPSATPATQSAAASQATNPDQARHPVPWVPRLPRKTTVDASLCHACHVKRRWMSPSATPATQSAAASQATNPDQARHPVPWVPRLPRKTTVDASLCHACHVKRRWMSPSATPATQSAAASQATNPDQARHPVPWVPRLPRKTTVDASFVPRLPRETKVDVTKCHACHAKCRGVTGDKSGPSAPPSTMSAPPATQNDGGCEFCATPATWNEGGCHQVPRLPRKVPRRHRRQIRTKRASQYHECHACHAKRRWMRVCATPATWNEGGCHQVPRLPRKVPRRHRRQIRTKRATQYHECHACHAKRRWMRVLCHACHVKRGWMSPSAMPATQSAAASQAATQCHVYHACHAKRRCVCVKWLSVKFAYVKFVCVKLLYVKFVCVKLLYVKFVCVKLLSVKFVCVKFVCVKFVYVKLLYIKFVCVKLLSVKFVCVKFVCVKLLSVKFVCVWNLCVLSLCMLSLCVWNYCMLSLCVWSYCLLSLCVLSLCVLSFCVWNYCMWSLCVWNYCMLSLCVWSYCLLSLCVLSLCVWNYCMLSLCVLCYGGGGRRRRSPGYRIKNKNPTQRCGEKNTGIEDATGRGALPWDEAPRWLEREMSVFSNGRLRYHGTSYRVISLPWCSMVLEYFPTFTRTKSPSFVGKYTSTMVRIWVGDKRTFWNMTRYLWYVIFHHRPIGPLGSNSCRRRHFFSCIVKFTNGPKSVSMSFVNQVLNTSMVVINPYTVFGTIGHNFSGLCKSCLR